MMYILQKSLDYKYIAELSIYECWLFFARESEDIAVNRYLLNLPADKKGKTIPYKPTFYISNE